MVTEEFDEMLHEITKQALIKYNYIHNAPETCPYKDHGYTSHSLALFIWNTS